MADTPNHQVEVHLYIKGQGPKHEFTTDLKGWQPNRLDLGSIKERYKLKSIYAYSVISGRGLELVPNPRNGLSFTVYQGKPGTVIRLDGEPKPPPFSFLSNSVAQLAAILFVVVLLVGIISMDAQRTEHFERMRKEGPGWPVILTGTLILVFYGWRLWTKSLSNTFQRRYA